MPASPASDEKVGSIPVPISHFLVSNSVGIKFREGPPNFSENSSSFQNVEAKIKFVCFSTNGKRLAWIANGEVCVVESPEWKRIGTLQHPKAVEACFSPNGSLLAIWDIFSQAKGTPATPNLSIYDVTEKKLLKTFVQKSHVGWQPQWTKDESIMARFIPSEVHFFEGKDFSSVKQKKMLPKLRSFSVSPSTRHHYATFFVPSLKDSPACVHLYKYPNFDSSNLIASKSFYKVDTVDTFWNKACTAVLLLTTSEVDKTGGSYYGEQMLFFLSTKGDSIRVTFAKQGNIRSVAWCPSSKEFFCVYGLSPARATVFNLKCDPVAEFGDGSRNLVMINPPGNLALIGGMGNISSNFEIWDIKEKKMIRKQDCADITHMEWSPCGQYILTSTCSPRLRVNNGYRVWHYTTSLLHETMCPESEELFRATWLPDPSAEKDFVISTTPVQGIQMQIKKASTQRYIPPSQRLQAKMVGGSVDTTKKFLSEREDPLKEANPKDKEKEMKRQKQKEKREERAKKKEEVKGMDKDWREKREEDEGTGKGVDNQTKKDNVGKRKKNIRKKLESIETLKADKTAGKFISKLQLEKIDSEEALRKELEELSVT